MDDTSVRVSLAHLNQLFAMADECLDMRFHEYSSPPSNEEKELMLHLCRLLGREVPILFVSKFGWTLD